MGGKTGEKTGESGERENMCGEEAARGEEIISKRSRKNAANPKTEGSKGKRVEVTATGLKHQENPANQKSTKRGLINLLVPSDDFFTPKFVASVAASEEEGFPRGKKSVCAFKIYRSRYRSRHGCGSAHVRSPHDPCRLIQLCCCLLSYFSHSVIRSSIGSAVLGRPGMKE